MSDDRHDTQDHQEEHIEQAEQAEQASTEEQQTQDHGHGAGEASAESNESGEAQQDEGQQEESQQEPAEDLFDLMGSAGDAFKKKKPEKPETSNPQRTQAAKKPEEKKFAAGNTIVYSGHKIELEEEMTADQLIAFLEDDFPELTKESTEFTHDEARSRIVPTRKALKKGAHSNQNGSHKTQAVEGGERGSGEEPLRSRRSQNSTKTASTIQVETQIPDGPDQQPPPVRRVLDTGGVYEIRNTTLGCFIVRIPPRMNLHLAEGAYLGLPKAPVSLLADIIKVFQAYADREALATIVYDHRNHKHRLVWVPQEATATSIEYDPVPESEELTIFCEIHSHNTMPAFYSQTDNKFEARSTALYGVVGDVQRERPSAAFRFSCGTHFRDLRAADIFEESAKMRDLISEDGA